jgi:transposase
MDQPACLGCRALERRVAELEAHVEHLTRLLDQQRRAGKRQAAPFAKGPPRGQPKKPGRKPGADYGTKAHRPPVVGGQSVMLKCGTTAGSSRGS